MLSCDLVRCIFSHNNEAGQILSLGETRQNTTVRGCAPGISFEDWASTLANNRCKMLELDLWFVQWFLSRVWQVKEQALLFAVHVNFHLSVVSDKQSI
jgi:hypothetical protein